MFTLIKQLRKSVIAILAVTILLMLQAFCDLSLPTYTADIVNVGIQQGGINRIVPDVIRSSEMDKLTLFLSEDETKELLSNYTLYSDSAIHSDELSISYRPHKFEIIRKSEMNASEWKKLTNRFPMLETENLYLWRGEAEETLTNILSLPMMLLYGIESDPVAAEQLKHSLTLNLPENISLTDKDLYTILTMLPPEARNTITYAMKEQLTRLPESIVAQSAISYVKAEYQAIGVNVSKLQSDYILFVGAKMIGLAFAAMLASVLVTFFAARIAAKLGKDLRNKVFQKVVSFSNKEMDQFSTASLITRSTNDIQQIQMLLVMLLRVAVYAPILAIGGIIKVLNTNTSMAWILVVGVATIFAIILVLYIIVMPKFRLMQKLVDRINLVMREIITGLPVIRAFSTEKHEKNRFEKANMDLTKNNLFVNRAMSFLMPSMMLIMNLITILIVWEGAEGINIGEMQVGDMMAFIQYTMQIIMSFLMLTMISIMLPRATVSAKRIDEILTTQTDISDPVKEEQFNEYQKGVVEFQQVHFRYPNAQEDVLTDISFTSKPGETTAIIGSTGSGKSTLINLIPRFYDVTKGSILINGVDIRKVKQKELRAKLGYVPQKGVLFTGTIESNIKFGNSQATDENMIRAARIAQATEFIESKTDGFQDFISEGGTNVSGGQKQRLSIARAIANNPEIYIFDDSFSALDFKTDVTLRRALKEETNDSTVLIVAQRISTILNADQILVLNEGRIVGKGTHKELLKSCEVYQQIAASQLSKEELNYE